ncbi:MAG TPA: hypothetical protein VF223_04950 [Trebonia sp.]
MPAVEQGRALAALVAGNRQREVSFRGYVRDGKLAEHWALLDSAALRHQLGASA